MLKKITLFALLISISGFIVAFYNNYEYNSIVFRIFDSLGFRISGGQDIFWIDGIYYNLFFNFILLIGAIIYYKTKENESRLLRFVFSILLFQQLFSVVLFLNYLLFNGTEIRLNTSLLFLVSLVLKIGIIYFVFKIMKHLNSLKSLDYETVVRGEASKIYYFNATSWQRFFHLIVDTIIFGLLLYQQIDTLAKMRYFVMFLEAIENIVGEQLAFTLLVFIFRTLFYFVFEVLFKATPAKFLTETRVGDDDGFLPSNEMIFKRTLCRSIPFNAFSFLLNANWHDSFSNTDVYKDKRTGFNGNRYFLLIPIFIVLSYGIHFLNAKKQENLYLESANREFEEKKSDLLNDIKTIDTNSILQLKNRNYDSNIVFLKAENISNTDVEFSVLNIKYQNIYNISTIGKMYSLAKDTLKKIKINKVDLSKLVIDEVEESPDYYGDDKKVFEGITTIETLRNKHIDAVIQLNSPNLKVGYCSFYDSNIVLQLENLGIAAEAIAIESKDKNVDWNKMNNFPMPFPKYGTIPLRAEGKDIEGYNFKITVQDSLMRKFVYEISSTNNPSKARIKLIK